jgi:putative membrane protein
MTGVRIASVGLSVSLLCAASTGWAADKATQKFMTEAIQGNLAEVAMGELAQQKGQSDAVKSFGQQLVKDHSGANQKATAVASGLGITSPTEPTKKQKADHDKLAKLADAKFDRAFSQAMVKDHGKDVKAYEKAAKLRDAEAANYASQTLPTLKQHLDMAKDLAKASGGRTSGASAGGNRT